MYHVHVISFVLQALRKTCAGPIEVSHKKLRRSIAKCYCYKLESDNKKPIEKVKRVIKELEGTKEKLWKSISSSKTSASLSSNTSKSREQVKTVQYKLHCLKRKCSALKIFKEAELVIDLAMQIYDFRTFQFYVQSLKNVALTEEGKKITKDNDILYFKFYVSGIKQEKSKPRITIPVKEHSKTFDNDGSGAPHCRASYNRTTDFKYRRGLVSVKVCLMKCSSDFSNFERSVQMASWELSLDDADCDITADEPQQYSDKKLGANKKLSKYVSDAKLNVSVTVIDQDKDYFKRKRQECAKGLKDTLKNISLFQKDAHDKNKNEPPLIDVNITYFGMTSMLHAAVSLYDMDIISDLQKGGIDTSTRSEEHGTAMDLAMDLWQKASERGDAKSANGFQHVINILKKM